MLQAKYASAQDKLQLVASSFSGLDTLTGESAEQVISVLGDLNVTRLIVTDAEGRALYDSYETESAKGKLVLFSEVVQALMGNDAFYCVYRGGTLRSYAAMPVISYNEPVGCVYIMDYDAEQGQLIADLETNILRSSVILEAAILIFSVFFSIVSSGRMRKIITSMRLAREGEYTHKIKMHGSDEYAMFAEEFNKLTDRLQESEEMQRQFVSDASHELKTPLAAIRLLTDSILQTDQMDMETVRDFVTDIGSEAERLSRITEDLLRLTRLDGGVVPSAYPVAVGPVLQRVERMLGMVAAEKGVVISGAVSEDAVALATDDDVHQILYNLMENAIKYSAAENGFVRVEVSVRDGQVVITVTDNGIGIPDEDLPHIFDRFYRVDKMRSREVGGTGLGLSIVKDTIKGRGGVISAGHGPDGVGTTFTVRLPLAQREEEA